MSNRTQPEGGRLFSAWGVDVACGVFSATLVPAHVPAREADRT